MKTEIIRPLDVKYCGAVLMDTDDDPGRLKDAVLYLDKKTKSMTDEQYLEWLEGKGQYPVDMDEVLDELATQEFSFIFKNRIHISGAVLLLVDMLKEQNGFFGNKKVNYIIDNPY